MSDQGASAALCTTLAVGGGLGVADVVSGGSVAEVVSGSGAEVVSGSGAEVVSGGGSGVADVVSGGGSGLAEVVSGVGAGVVGFFTHVGGLLVAAFFNTLSFLSEVAVGVVVGGGVVAVGFLLLAVVVEVGARRGEQVLRTPVVATQPHAVAPLAPRTLRWVRGLLPGDEGAAWLAEVTSCLAEAHDEVERRRHVRGYRRAVPQLIWTSWVLHLRGSRSRTLS